MTITVHPLQPVPFAAEEAPYCAICDAAHWSCRCPAPRPETTGSMQPLVRVEIENTPSWGNFKGCQDCTGDKGHELATFQFGKCRCPCHEIPSYGAVIGLACGCTKHKGIKPGQAEPQVGDLSLCWGMH